MPSQSLPSILSFVCVILSYLFVLLHLLLLFPLGISILNLFPTGFSLYLKYYGNVLIFFSIFYIKSVFFHLPFLLYSLHLVLSYFYSLLTFYISSFSNLFSKPLTLSSLSREFYLIKHYKILLKRTLLSPSNQIRIETFNIISIKNKIIFYCN